VSWIHVVQFAWAVIVAGIAFERVQSLCVRGPVDVEPLVRAVRTLTRGDALKLLVRLEGSFVATVLRVAVEHDAASDREVLVEEALVDAQVSLARRLSVLRIGASVCTLLAFVGVAMALGEVPSGAVESAPAGTASHPGMADAALSIALGAGGSSFALGIWTSLRATARRLARDCERAADRIRSRSLDSAAGRL
jgi:hypothetical protein